MKSNSIPIAYLFVYALILIGCQPSGTLTEDTEPKTSEPDKPLRQKSQSGYPTIISSAQERRATGENLNTGGEDSNTGGEDSNDSGGAPNTGDFWLGNTCKPPAYSSQKFVNDKPSFLAALKTARPGEVIYLQPGKVFHQARGSCMDIVGVHGAAGKPVIVTTSASNPAAISGGECGFAIMDASHLELSNIKVTGVSHWGMDIGGGNESRGRPVGANNVTIKNMAIEHTGIEGVVVNSKSYNINILCNEIHHTGDNEAIYGEGIYVGKGSGTVDTSNHVKIAYNRIHHTKSEAIDIKHGTTHIDILSNHIYDIELQSQGAITIGIANVDYPSGEYKVIGNRIHDIIKREHDGAAIVVGHGNTWISNNIIWNIRDFYAIYTQHAFGNANAKNVYIYNNTIINAPTGPLALNLGAHTGGPGNAIATNNLWEADIPGNLRATTADFLATQGLADSGKGPGSGLQLKPTSNAANKTSSTQVVPKDILGQPRPNGSGISYGAFQHGAM